jgi:hypothetical protein
MVATLNAKDQEKLEELEDRLILLEAGLQEVARRLGMRQEERHGRGC